MCRSGQKDSLSLGSACTAELKTSPASFLIWSKSDRIWMDGCLIKLLQIQAVAAKRTMFIWNNIIFRRFHSFHYELPAIASIILSSDSSTNSATIFRSRITATRWLVRNTSSNSEEMNIQDFPSSARDSTNF